MMPLIASRSIYASLFREGLKTVAGAAVARNVSFSKLAL
jgi:hypothetical protein